MERDLKEITMKKDICLISVSHDINNLGMRRISSFLKLNNIGVRLIFVSTAFEKLSSSGLMEIIKKVEGFDLIGISFMTNFKDVAFQISDAIRKHTTAKIIMGGVHATNDFENCLDKADFVVLGEGEHATLQIFKSLRENKNKFMIPNVYYKMNEKMIKNKLCLADDFDNLPFMDYNLDDDYIYEYGKVNHLDKNLFRCYFGKTYYIMTSYGCPFNCSYCCNGKYNELFGYKQRLRTLSKVLQEIIEFKKKYSFIKEIRFADDLFFIHSISKVKEFLKQYKKQVGLPFIIIGGHAAFITDEKMELLYNAGLKQIFLGIQSGSAKTNKIFNRNVSNEKVLEAVNILSKYGKKGVLIEYEIITDNPWENEKDRLETVNLLLKFPKPFSIVIFSLTPFKGTPIYDILKEMNLPLITGEGGKQYYDFKEDYLNLCIYFIHGHLPVCIIKWIIEKRNSKLEPFIMFIMKITKRNNSRFGLIKETFLKVMEAIIKIDIVSIKFFKKKIIYESRFWMKG